MVTDMQDYFQDIYGNLSQMNFHINLQNITSANYITFTITDAYKFRPDLMAQDFLGNIDLGWFLLLFNNITTQEQIDSGKTINIPTKAFITANYNLITKEVL